MYHHFERQFSPARGVTSVRSSKTAQSVPFVVASSVHVMGKPAFSWYSPFVKL